MPRGDGLELGASLEDSTLQLLILSIGFFKLPSKIVLKLQHCVVAALDFLKSQATLFGRRVGLEDLSVKLFALQPSGGGRRETLLHKLLQSSRFVLDQLVALQLLILVILILLGGRCLDGIRRRAMLMREFRLDRPIGRRVRAR